MSASEQTQPLAAAGALVRAAVLVADLERSVAFYRDVLGLDEVLFEGRVEDPALGTLLDIDGLDNLQCAILKAPGPPFGMLGLFAAPAIRPQGGNDGKAGAGTVCLVFNRPDLDALYGRVVDAGNTVVSPPVSLRVSDSLTSREMSFRDPDGVLINCIER